MNDVVIGMHLHSKQSPQYTGMILRPITTTTTTTTTISRVVSKVPMDIMVRGILV